MNAKHAYLEKLPALARQAKWSVKELARLCGVSVRTLERHCREEYHQTPEAWLAEQRWQQALVLQRQGASVKSMATDVGYRQASTFSREFKKRFGQSPVALAHSPATATAAPPVA